MNLNSAIDRAVTLLLSHQSKDGYWWYTLEANETIGACTIFLLRFLGIKDEELERGLTNRILSQQRDDGTWGLYYGGPPDLSTTIECYTALKLVGLSPSPPPSPQRGEGELTKARQFILDHGGLTKSRIFTRIHLALFGVVPWSTVPSMPVGIMLLPNWFPINIYDFSSWARASIVPLLIVMDKKPVRSLNHFNLDELYVELKEQRQFQFEKSDSFVSWKNFFNQFDRVLKLLEKFPVKPLKSKALNVAEEWIADHIAKTEDIFPALAYSAMAMSALGHPNSHPTIQKALAALGRFRQDYCGELPAVADNKVIGDQLSVIGNQLPVTSDQRSAEAGVAPFSAEGGSPPNRRRTGASGGRVRQFAQAEACYSGNDKRANERTSERVNESTHQQCCISPVWDTPWMIKALLEAGLPPDHPALLKAGRWLISKQIRETRGDWKIKNPNAEPGGWSFEFENEYFPDVDDTIEVLTVLNRLAISGQKSAEAGSNIRANESIQKGLSWFISMQNKDGGWGAFDKDNNLELVNKIPFSDHGACLDPSTPDVTARAIGLLSQFGWGEEDGVVKKAIRFLKESQEPFGGWFGRWGVNYVYGTWCVLTGLSAIGEEMREPYIQKAVQWLKSIQHEDGGWSESPEGYKVGYYLPYPSPPPSPQRGEGDSSSPSPLVGEGKPRGIPSQTAWAVMGLIAVGEQNSPEVRRGIEFLLKTQCEDGGWNEPHHTGTGFPGHFYIRYHGYRHYFPLLALGVYKRSMKQDNHVSCIVLHASGIIKMVLPLPQ